MPEPLGIGGATELTRFERYIVSGPHVDSCAIWVGAIADDGYGRFWLMRDGRQRVVRPHRYALARALGVPLTDEVTALHLCDNPICVRVTLDEDTRVGRVRHVVDGTQSQNLLDMGAKGRGGGRRQRGLWYGPDRVARAARSRRLRDAVQGGWNEDAVRAALLDAASPTLF
ncbi:hypothetical protein E4P29_22165 [Rhodococcus sp. 1R11]|uniref:hypothetical protein n=1 Tax=Rhodococcus sp. 1R11 TaxID=2559614 RepID=UPI00107188AB|nr:hypothetical protein [Rhodococcus sp. 1R11]TFI40899.1 hypothetical protein E4P29_22165 [Rhodococcus sp. 1R11]